MNLLTFLQPRAPLPSARRRDRARARMAALIAGIVADRRARGVDAEDFLQTLMGARYADGRALDDEEIAGLLLATVFAGQHTSAVLATWTGVLLLEHATHLAPVLDEQGDVFGAGREMTIEALRQLVTLERCIKEAERMHPPLILLMRRVLRDLEVNGHVVPAGGIAVVSPAAAHRIPEVFADPDRYDPDRFGPGRQEDRKHRHALIGFGGGHHRCIGSTFAYQQVKAIWSVLLQRFELTLVRHGHEPDYSTFVPGPRAPCLVRYVRRPRGERGPGAGGRLRPIAMTAPQSFADARNLRQRVRAAGLDPNHWYAVEYDRAVRPGEVVATRFWGGPIALYRGADGRVRALEDRCAHRQLPLSLGEVTGCALTCAYHGWSYGEDGSLAGIPHDRFGRPMPSLRIRAYPVAIRYGLIWLFPGDPALAPRRPLPDVPELEGPDPWAYVPHSFTWRAHHSMVIDNLCDLTHAHLHRSFPSFQPGRLLGSEARGRPRADALRGEGRAPGPRALGGAERAGDRYEYPYHRRALRVVGHRRAHHVLDVPLAGGRGHHARVLHVLLRHAQDPVAPVHARAPAPHVALASGKLGGPAPAAARMAFALEAEQHGYEAHPDAPLIELNPVVGLLHRLTVRKWEEHLLARGRARAAEVAT